MQIVLTKGFLHQACFFFQVHFGGKHLGWCKLVELLSLWWTPAKFTTAENLSQ